MVDGLLVVDLKRELPEELKPERWHVCEHALPAAGRRRAPARLSRCLTVRRRNRAEAQVSDDTQPFRNQWIAAMRDPDSLLESFEPEMVETIRSAFQAGWHELCNAGVSSDPYALRNRLARTIASLARSGISDRCDQ